MFLLSLAKTYNYTANVGVQNATRTSPYDHPLPFNLTVMMDEMCYQQINGGKSGQCIESLQAVVPFNVIYHKDYFIKEYEQYHSSRFHCTPYKMDIARLPDFRHLNYLLVVDIDCLTFQKLDHMWVDVTTTADVLATTSLTNSTRSPVLNEKIIFWSALEVSNISASGLKTFPDAKNAWYIQRNKQHYYPPTGLNTGVIVYNLYLMRKKKFTIQEFVKVNTEDVQLADQDYLNSWAFYNQDKVGLLNCTYNVRRNINCIDHEVHPTSGEITREYDLFNTPDKAHIFHGNNGYTRRGPGKAISFPFRHMFNDICGFWTPL